MLFFIYSFSLVCPNLYSFGNQKLAHLFTNAKKLGEEMFQLPGVLFFSPSPPTDKLGGPQERSSVTGTKQQKRSGGEKQLGMGLHQNYCRESAGVQIYHAFALVGACSSSLVDYLTAGAAGVLGHRGGLSGYQVMWQRKGAKC